MAAISEGLVKSLKAAGMESTAWQATERHVLVRRGAHPQERSAPPALG